MKAVRGPDDNKNAISDACNGKKFKNDVVGVQRGGFASNKSVSYVESSRVSSVTTVKKKLTHYFGTRRLGKSW